MTNRPNHPISFYRCFSPGTTTFFSFFDYSSKLWEEEAETDYTDKGRTAGAFV